MNPITGPAINGVSIRCMIMRIRYPMRLRRLPIRSALEFEDHRPLMIG
jgi:hypothetical protein